MALRNLLTALLLCRIAWAGYTEQLTLRPLPRNTLLTSFRFDIDSQNEPANNSSYYDEYKIFPRSLGQILQHTNARELHLRFSQGWWDAENWGALPDGGEFAGGIGVEVWAVMQGETRSEAFGHWKRLVNALSGLFCASLNFLDESQTSFPVRTFDATANGTGLHLLHGSLPREPVCTENLTPFLKMLPCQGKAGISSLLDSHKIFDSQWQSMSIDVRTKPDGTRSMTQTINAVIDVNRALARRIDPVPRPVPTESLRCDTSKPYDLRYVCMPLTDAVSVSWNLTDIFGRPLRGECPVASNADHVLVDVSDNWRVSPGNANVMTLPKNEAVDVVLETDDSTKHSPLRPVPISAERSFTGYGQERGGLRTEFSNPSQTESVSFVYFETLPWYMRLYLHTLEVEVQAAPAGQNYAKDDFIRAVSYRPAADRARPSQLELQVTLPPATSISLSYDFDKSLLYIEEYPPDANHGFEIAPAILTVLSTDRRPSYVSRTAPLLLSLPTPDFSMPYNVVILSCTVMALAFGTVFNMLTKRILPEKEVEALSRELPISKIIAAVRTFFRGPDETVARPSSS